MLAMNAHCAEDRSTSHKVISLRFTKQRAHLLLSAALLSTSLLGALGCKSTSYSDRFGFGTIDRQKAKAADFDPYPLNDIGPSVVGGRPPGFFNPLPEPRRNELQAQNKRYAYP
jgi:hypothetical protein